MAYQFLTCEEQEGAALITLNRPEKRNALSTALRKEIESCLLELEEGGGGAVVLTGAGSTFCAGFDLSEFTADNMDQIFSDAVSYHRKVYTCRRPLIAAVNGNAYAGGMDLAVMCDLRIAAESAAFGQPQVKMGIPAAYDLIHTLVPQATARELCLTGRSIAAQEALHLGLVNRVVSDDDLMQEAMALAGEITASQASGAMKASFVSVQPDLFS
jgi:enoyl-CoA hydratase/carnithine racemase|tara:strand:- start:1254 stop:1895 length:642 start_codon:yes stop_codon:yes gene_type:complete